jgi:hypothetical protein
MALKNECLDIATAELVAADTPFKVSYGGKHIHLRFNSLSGAPQLIILSRNGNSGGTNYAWTRANVRRKLRQ